MLCVCLDLFLLDDLFYVEVFIDRPQMMNLMWMSSKTLRSIGGIHNFHYGIKCRKIHSFPLLKGFFEIRVNFLKWYLNNFGFIKLGKAVSFESTSLMSIFGFTFLKWYNMRFLTFDKGRAIKFDFNFPILARCIKKEK